MFVKCNVPGSGVCNIHSIRVRCMKYTLYHGQVYVMYRVLGSGVCNVHSTGFRCVQRIYYRGQLCVMYGVGVRSR